MVFISPTLYLLQLKDSGHVRSFKFSLCNQLKCFVHGVFQYRRVRFHVSPLERKQTLRKVEISQRKTTRQYIL